MFVEHGFHGDSRFPLREAEAGEREHRIALDLV